MCVFKARVSESTSFGIERVVSPEKVPDDANAAKAVAFVMSTVRPALIVSEILVEAFPSAVSRSPICID